MKKILEFDITGVLGSEINQHIDFFNIGVEEAYVAAQLFFQFFMDLWEKTVLFKVF